MKRREERLAKIREAKVRLEAEARAEAEDEQRRRDEEQVKREAEGRKRRGKEAARIDPTPEDKVNELHRRRSEGHEAEQQGIRLFLQRSSRGG